MEVSIIFSDHALFQMKEREIGRQRVIDCLLHPDKVVEEWPGRYRAMKGFRRGRKKHLFIVAYDRREKQIEIVTAFITSKLKKYL